MYRLDSNPYLCPSVRYFSPGLGFPQLATLGNAAGQQLATVSRVGADEPVRKSALKRAEAAFPEVRNDGKVPGLRAIKAALSVGQPKQQLVQAHLKSLRVTTG